MNIKTIRIATTIIMTVMAFCNPAYSKIKSKHNYIMDSTIRTDTFKVSGNCGMCKNRIEGALKGVKGIESAVWNNESQMITVKYDKVLITLSEIKQLIAKVGHDTDTEKADDKVYEKLPGCCKYER